MNSAVIVAGGIGSRTSLNYPKQFYNLCDREILSYSVETFKKHPEINEVIIACHKDWINHVQKKYPKCIIVIGGERRRDSVLNGIMATDSASKNVLIHDGARPFVTSEIISNCIQALNNSSACAPILDSLDSLVKLDENNISYVNRSKIKSLQTPQCFKRSLIINVLNSEYEGSDEIGILLQYKSTEKIQFVEGNPKNIKITTPNDLVIATSILKSR